MASIGSCLFVCVLPRTGQFCLAARLFLGVFSLWSFASSCQCCHTWRGRLDGFLGSALLYPGHFTRLTFPVTSTLHRTKHITAFQKFYAMEWKCFDKRTKLIIISEIEKLRSWTIFSFPQIKLSDHHERHSQWGANRSLQRSIWHLRHRSGMPLRRSDNFYFALVSKRLVFP